MAHDEAMTYLKSVHANLKQHGIDARLYVDEGDQVADVLLRAVQALEVDTIVMSTHGRSGIQRWIFGSVADRLLKQANIPILIIRASELENEQT
jgi:nucleotide-binding universal stress UspA family protein